MLMLVADYQVQQHFSRGGMDYGALIFRQPGFWRLGVRRLGFRGLTTHCSANEERVQNQEGENAKKHFTSPPVPRDGNEETATHCTATQPPASIRIVISCRAPKTVCQNGGIGPHCFQPATGRQPGPPESESLPPRRRRKR